MDDAIDEEAYMNNYGHFERSLAILSQDAAAQCKAMGYSNVPWEIKDEVISNGNAVLNTVAAQLSEYQKDRIRLLLASMSDIPDAVINTPNSKEALLLAMNNPCWVPLRAQAKQLSLILSLETERVNRLLNVRSST